MIDINAKCQAVAQIINGHVLDNKDRVAISIKGLMLGFPAQLEAIYPSWPFGVMYTVDTRMSEERAGNTTPPFALTVCPRVGHGLFSFATRILLIESSGMPVHNKKLEKLFNFTYNKADPAERFINYPGLPELLTNLHSNSKFSELIINNRAGVYLSQPISFKGLDLDVCRVTFKTLAELAQILFEAF